jgi:hypothetical protein
MGAVVSSKRRNEGPAEVEKPEDAFVTVVREKMQKALNAEGWDAKEQNLLFANCIKFIAVTMKLKGDDGSFFDD